MLSQQTVEFYERLSANKSVLKDQSKLHSEIMQHRWEPNYLPFVYIAQNQLYCHILMNYLCGHGSTTVFKNASSLQYIFLASSFGKKCCQKIFNAKLLSSLELILFPHRSAHVLVLSAMASTQLLVYRLASFYSRFCVENSTYISSFLFRGRQTSMHCFKQQMKTFHRLELKKGLMSEILRACHFYSIGFCLVLGLLSIFGWIWMTLMKVDPLYYKIIYILRLCWPVLIYSYLCRDILMTVQFWRSSKPLATIISPVLRLSSWRANEFLTKIQAYLLSAVQQTAQASEFLSWIMWPLLNSMCVEETRILLLNELEQLSICLLSLPFTSYVSQHAGLYFWVLVLAERECITILMLQQCLLSNLEYASSILSETIWLLMKSVTKIDFI